jgi:hypothetical protein
MSPGQKVAVRMFVAEREDGQMVVVPQGARFPASSPVVKANPTMFKPPPRRKPATLGR